MPMDALPTFPYHPDPLRTGSIRESDTECVRCGRSRGYVYVGPVYSEDEIEDELCPWCIADGSAAERFGADFCDAVAPEEVSREVLETITKRTPGFAGWQQERWLFHCDDGAAYLGRVGARELEGDEAALSSLRAERDGWAPEKVEEYVAALDRDRPPTAYLFECRVCGTHLAYSDYT